MLCIQGWVFKKPHLVSDPEQTRFCLLDFEFWRSFARVSASVNEALPGRPNYSCLRRCPPGENHNTNHLAASVALPDKFT